MNIHRARIAAALLVVASFLRLSDNAEAVYLEHSIRCANESSFPYYLKMPEVRYAINSIIEDRFKQKIQF